MKTRILDKDGIREVSLNRRTAIREKCLNCSGWSPKEVKECSHTDCPLYPFRTGEGKQNSCGKDEGDTDLLSVVHAWSGR